MVQLFSVRNNPCQAETLASFGPYPYAVSWTPPPGTIGLTYSYGITRFRASLGHRLLGESTHYNHTFVVIGDNRAIEPWPTGARIITLDEFDGEDVAYGWLSGLSDRQRESVATAALSLRGIGYGLADYIALSAARAGSRHRRVIQRMHDPNRLLPAQFVDEAYRLAGVYLLPDRAAHDVSLDQLGELFLTSTEWELRVPCTLYV